MQFLSSPLLSKNRINSLRFQGRELTVCGVEESRSFAVQNCYSVTCEIGSVLELYNCRWETLFTMTPNM